MVADTPDWTSNAIVTSGNIDVSAGDISIAAGQSGVNVSVNTPPRSAGSVIIPVGSATATRVIAPSADATGILIMAPPGPVGVGVNEITLQVVGTLTGKTYYNDFSAVNTGIAAIFGVDLTRESSYTVTIGTASNVTGANYVANVYEILASGIQQVVGSSFQPLPVQISEAANRITKANQIQSGTGTGAAGTSQGNINIGTNSYRWLRRAHFAISGGGSAGTAGHNLQLKGFTSGTVVNLLQLAMFSGGQSQLVEQDYSDFPLDLTQLFPTDGRVDFIINSAANYAWSWSLTVTP